MRISSVGMPFLDYHKSSMLNRTLISASQKNDADIFSFKGGNENSGLSEKIAIIPSVNKTGLEKNIERQLGVNALNTQVKHFKNGETYVNIDGKIRGKDVYIMPASGDNVNENLMETYLKADAAKRAGAEKVIAVMPSFYYARQEKRASGLNEPIAARLNMDLLKASGVDEIITVDLHSASIEGFAGNDMPVTNLESMPVMLEYLKSKNLKNTVIVSPDTGGVKRADKLAKAIGCEKAIVYKYRHAHNEASAETLIGDVFGKNCIIFDDIIDTAGTIAEAAKLLKTRGAKDIYVCAAHGLFNGDAMEKLQNAPVKEIIATNSVKPKKDVIDKIKYVDMSSQIAGAMLDISA